MNGKDAPLQHKQIVGVQHLRGLAALAVVIEHVNGLMGLGKYLGASPIEVPLHAGAAGVNLFFVISGFIIVVISLRPPDLHARLTFGEFIRRRAARIVPFLWVCVAGYAGLRYLGRGEISWDSYLRAFFLYPIGPVNPNQVWTLRHELLFYLVFATVLVLPRFRFWFVGAWFVSPLVFLSLVGASADNGTVSEQLTAFAFSRFNLLFGFGFLCGLAYVQFPGLFRVGNFVGWIWCAIAVVMLTYLYTLIDYSPYNTVHILLLGVAGAAVLHASIALGRPAARGALDRLGKLLGDASYSIYLTHGAFASALIGFASRWPESGGWLLLAVVSAVCVLGGVLLHWAVELPLVRFFQGTALGFGEGVVRTAERSAPKP